MKKSFLFLIASIFLIGFSFSQESTWNQTNEKGEKIGDWRAFYPNGKIRYVGSFENNLPVDTFYYYFQSGKLKTFLEYDSINSAKAKLYYETGEKMADGRYTNRKKEGMWVSYGANNIKVEQGAFLDGKKYGLWKTFYEDGSVSMEVNFENDLEQGAVKHYFIDGKLKQEANYKDGFLDGLSINYDGKGKKVLKGIYYKGARDGKWIYYDEQQTMETILEYDKGQLLNPDALKEINYNSDQYRSNVKDVLEFEDLRGRIKYE